MKITNVETVVITMPMKITGPVPMQAGRPRTSMDMLLIRVDTDAGISGWGEAFALRVWQATRAALDHLIGPLCIGRDASAISTVMDDLARAVHNVGRNGPVTFGLSAIDIALWDIAGKAAGKPLYQLLGGSTRSDLPAYASLLRYVDPDTVARYTAEAVGRGYRHIKLHEIGVPQVEAAREAAGDATAIMIDTNCPWTVPQAIDMGRQFAPFNPYWLEEPVWPPEDYAGLAEVRRETGLSIAAGENAAAHDFKRMFETGAITYAQPSITKVGGVTEMQKIIALADTAGVTVVPHSPYYGPGLIASMHVVAAMERESLVERYYADFEETPMGDAIHPVRGRLPIPQGAGLGVDPDPAILKKLQTGG